MEHQKHKAEWIFLQEQFESYEKHSLYIKLVSIAALLVIVIAKVDAFFAFSILSVLWLQDAIWKTFQSRIEPRLFEIEAFIRDDSDSCEFQFNSEYEKRSKKGGALVVEYVKQAVRPTIAFPHFFLIMTLAARFLLS